MLRVDSAVVEFDGCRVVDGVDLAVGPGETVAILGPSGSGKTTLLRAIAGLQALDAGRVSWDGNDVTRTPPHQRRFGMVFQEYALFPHRDVAGNVAFGLRMARVDPSTRTRRVDEVLALVGLSALRARRVAGLSGGEQQRVALARAVAVEPRLLMLDEPLGALDPVWRRRLLDELRSILDRARLPALYVTHDHDEAFSIADRVAVMRAGRLVQIGTPAEVWRAPVDAWTATFLGFGPVLAGRMHGEAVETALGAVKVGYAVAGDVVDVVLRPDAVRLDDDGAVDASVRAVRFAGRWAEVDAAVDDTTVVTLVVEPVRAPKLGARVGLTIEPDGVLVYPRPAD